MHASLERDERLTTMDDCVPPRTDLGGGRDTAAVVGNNAAMDLIAPTKDTVSKEGNEIRHEKDPEATAVDAMGETTANNENNATTTEEVMSEDPPLGPLVVLIVAVALPCLIWMNWVSYTLFQTLLGPQTTSSATLSTTAWAWRRFWKPSWMVFVHVGRFALGACSVALGLGMATYVYDHLSENEDDYRALWERFRESSAARASGGDTPKHSNTNSNTSSDSQTGTSNSTVVLTEPSVWNEGSSRLSSPPSGWLPSWNRPRTRTASLDEQTYASLMQSANYPVHPTYLRGQVLRRNTRDGNTKAGSTPSSQSTIGASSSAETASSFYEHVKPEEGRAADIFQEIWGDAKKNRIAEPIRRQLARLMEYVVRDFCLTWFARIDDSLKPRLPQPAATLSTQQQPIPRNVSEKDSTEFDQPQTSTPQSTTIPPEPQQSSAEMLYILGHHRASPFLEGLYETLAVVMGNLATRVEDVNLFQIVLVQWTQILGQSFQTYRTLRHRCSKSTRTGATSAVSEMAVTREFLLAGKLHRALTFGLDVPSLLFADAKGRECGIPPKKGQDPSQQTRPKVRSSSSTFSARDDEVLEARLFDSGLLRECELDYHRIIAHRMIKALFRMPHGNSKPVAEDDLFAPLVQGLVTEIMAACVLMPVMNLFHPDNINQWIINGLDRKSGNKDNTKETVSASNSNQPNNIATPNPTPSKTSRGGVETPLSPLSVNSHRSTPQASGSGGDAFRTPVKSPQNRFSPQHLSVTSKGSTKSHDLVDLLCLALDDLADFVPFDIRSPRRLASLVDWSNEGCRSAVLALCLVLEAALVHGRCPLDQISEHGCETQGNEVSVRSNPLNPNLLSATDVSSLSFEKELEGHDEEGTDNTDSGEVVEVTLLQYEKATLPQVLMEMTSDIDAFEERIAGEQDTSDAEGDEEKQQVTSLAGANLGQYHPTATEQSTLRTLIAAWLHTGQIHRVVSILVQAHSTILTPFYKPGAFMRSPAASVFCQQLRVLHQMDILVDTMTILSSPRLDQMPYDEQRRLFKNAPDEEFEDDEETLEPEQTIIQDDEESKTDSVSPSPSVAMSSLIGAGGAIPRHFDYHRNEAFAASLRSERLRRTQSWWAQFEEDKNKLLLVTRRKATTEDINLHKELHHIAKIYYGYTNLVGIRDAARRKNSGETQDDDTTASDLLSLLTVETACARRRIEVPDDDSSFLLRAQPRPLTAVGVHRDQRNHDQSFKCFAATYEEPATAYSGGGRYIRRCLIRYFPIDRTVTVLPQNDARRIDQRRSKTAVPETITVDSSVSPQTPYLSADYLRERHLCNRWMPRGSTRTLSLLASNVMEPSDFTAQPRTGKAIDFVHRITFYEKPMIELSGRHFTVHDSSILGVHRADASAIEMSDAALSTALLSLGDVGRGFKVEMGVDGYPIVWMKFTGRQDDKQLEVKPYRVSFVRAALLVTSARQEAQMQSLIACVRAASAKQATKALTDARLQPSLRLLHHAGHKNREKQALLSRDLKLGFNNIDRGQLCRNGLLNPRHPTKINELDVRVDGVMQAEQIIDASLFGVTGTVYKIRCSAVVELIATEDELHNENGYKRFEGDEATLFREEWVVYRSFREFQTLHKHLKGEVSTNESSGTTVSRLSASLNATTTVVRRDRKVLIPSLSQASNIAALGVTSKVLEKRKEYLDNYVRYLFAPGNFLNKCPELLLFVGAFYPFPSTVEVGTPVTGVSDPLGRANMVRTVIEPKKPSVQPCEFRESPGGLVSEAPSTLTPRLDARDRRDTDEYGKEHEQQRKTQMKNQMIPAIRNKIDRVPLSLVRNRMFDLLRYQFGFENASFVRNRMLSAVKTASFAITSASEFRKTLYKLHTQYVSTEAVARWIKIGIDIIWPNGVFFKPIPPPTAEELVRQVKKSKKVLHSSFPDALRTVVGSQLTRDGLDLLHEMLQNRVILKSMAYLLFDKIWLEVFPEIGDVIQGTSDVDLNH